MCRISDDGELDEFGIPGIARKIELDPHIPILISDVAESVQRHSDPTRREIGETCDDFWVKQNRAILGKDRCTYKRDRPAVLQCINDFLRGGGFGNQAG
jgi:hypothetical protein